MSTSDESAPRQSYAEDTPDRLLIRVPGLQAEFAAQALNLEGIPCRLECEGLEQLRRPGDEPGDPFAVTLPVEIYVPASAVATAREVLQSLGRDDLIGEQWDGGDPAPDETVNVVEAETPSPAVAPGALDSPPMPSGQRMEGTGLRLILILVAAGLVALLYRW